MGLNLIYGSIMSDYSGYDLYIYAILCEIQSESKYTYSRLTVKILVILYHFLSIQLLLANDI